MSSTPVEGALARKPVITTESDSSSQRKPVATPFVLPAEPLFVIKPSKSWAPLNLSDLWPYRELLYFLIWRDVKVRYKQTALGVVWVVLQPLLTTVIFTIFLGKLARVPSDNLPYALFVYAAMVLWTFFSSAVSSSTFSLVGNANLITKVYFPRMIIPGAAVGARIIDFGISFVMLAMLMIYYRVTLTKMILFLPLFIMLVVLLGLGLGVWASALNVKYRDVGMVLPVLIQLWMFASPVVYPSSLVPGKYKWLYDLNPMVGILEGFRASLFGLEMNWRALTISIVFTVILLVWSLYAFRRTEKAFADVV